MFSDDDRMLLRILADKRFPSRSPYAEDANEIETVAGFAMNDDGMDHALQVESGARLGIPKDLAALQKTASGQGPGWLLQDPQQNAYWTDRAGRVLAQISAAPTPSPGPAPPGPGPVPIPPPGPAPAPSPQKITLLTVNGFKGDMWQGYGSDLARRMDPDVFYHQPVGNWDINQLPMKPACDAGVAECHRLLQEVHPTGPWALAVYSEGAIIGSRVYQALLTTLADRADDFVGGVAFGNPMREQGQYAAGTDPGGHGIASQRISGTGPLWKEYVDPGDIYANVSGPSGEDCTAIYDLVYQANPVAFLRELLELFTNPAPNLLAMAMAIKDGIEFAASNPMTAAHVQYQWREIVPGQTYFDHACAFMAGVGDRSRR